MGSFLSSADAELFSAINHFQSAWVDAVFVPLTDLHKYPATWIALAVTFIGALLWKRKDWPRWHIHAAKVVLLCGFAVGIADLVAYRGVKIWVKRPRPEQAGLNPILRTHSHSGFSFPSNHAANNFAAATVLTLLFQSAWLRWMVFVFAGAVSLSRVVVGVHYPGDILAGACIGLASGYFVYRLQLRIPGFKLRSHAERVGRSALSH